MDTRTPITTADLDKIKLPLSEEDYQMLRSSRWDRKYREELTDAYFEKFEWKQIMEPDPTAAFSDM